MRNPWTLTLTLGACVLMAQAAWAQTPTIAHAQMTSQAVAGDFDRTLSAEVAKAVEATWIGWFVPARGGSRACCDSSFGGTTTCGCFLEGHRSGTVTTGGSVEVDGRVVMLEGDPRLAVLVRVENRAVQRVAAYAASCALDAGGKRVVWLDGVDPAASVAWLTRQASSEPAGVVRIARHVDGALLAISMHDHASATPALLGLAKSAANAHVRGQALFWLAQQAGAKVAGAIVAAIDTDPEVDVRKRAVFALSQLPKDEGVPLLINVARTNRHAEVKRQAMFWLGQSKDPRALAFFEEVLTR
jgi:hypothetical protein